MKTLIVTIIGLFLATQVALTQEVVEQSAPATRMLTPMEIIATFTALFLMFRLFDVKAKKKVAVVAEEVEQPSLVEMVTEQVGELETVSDNSSIGGKLMESKDDVETYIFVAKLDKTQVRQEENEKAEKQSKKFVRTVMALITVIFALVTYLILR